MDFFRLVNPNYLFLLLLLLPFVLWMGRNLWGLGKKRRILALGLRCLILILLVLSLAEIHASQVSDRQTVIFVIDDSNSMPADSKVQAQEYIIDKLKEKPKDDEAGILVFAGNVSMEYSPQETLDNVEFRSVVNRNQTNISSALRLGLAALSDDTQKRIVLISDGNETMGYAEDIARQAKSHNAVIDIYPITYNFRNDIVVEKFIAPHRVKANDPFNLRVFVYSNIDTRAKMEVTLDGFPIYDQEISLRGGEKNPFIMPTTIPEGDSTRSFHNYQVRVDPINGEVDSNKENNRGSAFTWTSGTPRVLIVEGVTNPEEQFLAQALIEGEIEVAQCDAQNIPHSYEELLNYDTIIFNNVGASELTRSQMEWLETAVHELGIGFIMVGGAQSFGAGGYQDTPIEKLLPVEMEIKQKKVIPKGALAIVLHTCEFANGNKWARDISHVALDVLSSRDMMGVYYYDYANGDSRLFPMQEVGAKTRLHKKIGSCNPGDMPAFEPTLNMAYKDLMASNSSVKHIVIISDGDAGRPLKSTLKGLALAQITVSTICINPHSGSDTSIMKEIATVTGGTAYNPKSPTSLPKIFIKEATIVRQSLIVEETFSPAFRTMTDMLAGFDEGGWPSLHGYVATTAKPLADVSLAHLEMDNPILASWRYGIGKSAAFTSDATNRWAVEWMGWERFSKFWSQIVRWSMRSVESGNFQMTTSIENGQGKIVIDSTTEEEVGEFTAMLIEPNLTRRLIQVRQTEAGRFEADFEADQIGTYLIRAQPEGTEQILTGGLSMSYSPEYRSWKSNEALLLALQEETGGRDLRDPDNDNVFEHNLAEARRSEPIWPLSMAIALLLVPVDIFVRRVLLDWKTVKNVIVLVWEKVLSFFGLLWRRKEVRDETVESLLNVKERIREAEQADKEGDEQTAPQPRKPAPATLKGRRELARKDRMAALDKTKTDDRVLESTQKVDRLRTQSQRLAGQKKKSASDSRDAAPVSELSRLMAAKQRARRKRK